jgi:hypothetical protein
MYDILSLANSTLSTADMILLYNKKPVDSLQCNSGTLSLCNTVRYKNSEFLLPLSSGDFMLLYWQIFVASAAAAAINNTAAGILCCYVLEFNLLLQSL